MKSKYLNDHKAEIYTMIKEQMLALSQLHLGFGRDRILLSDVNVSLAKGELAVLLGANGSGKSTLLRTILGLKAPTQGKVEIEGKDCVAMDGPARAALASAVFTQRTAPSAMKVLDLVALGSRSRGVFGLARTKVAHKRAAEALRAVGLLDFTHKNLHQLSDGEYQKSMIARALVQDTPLVVLDEPTAFLDLPSKNDFAQLLLKLKGQGKTVVLSTHDLDFARAIADKVWVLDKNSRRLLEKQPSFLHDEAAIQSVLLSAQNA